MVKYKTYFFPKQCMKTTSYFYLPPHFCEKNPPPFSRKNVFALISFIDKSLRPFFLEKSLRPPVMVPARVPINFDPSHTR